MVEVTKRPVAVLLQLFNILLEHFILQMVLLGRKGQASGAGFQFFSSSFSIVCLHRTPTVAKSRKNGRSRKMLTFLLLSAAGDVSLRANFTGSQWKRMRNSRLLLIL